MSSEDRSIYISEWIRAKAQINTRILHQELTELARRVNGGAEHLRREAEVVEKCTEAPPNIDMIWARFDTIPEREVLWVLETCLHILAPQLAPFLSIPGQISAK